MEMGRGAYNTHSPSNSAKPDSRNSEQDKSPKKLALCNGQEFRDACARNAERVRRVIADGEDLTFGGKAKQRRIVEGQIKRLFETRHICDGQQVGRYWIGKLRDSKPYVDAIQIARNSELDTKDRERIGNLLNLHFDERAELKLFQIYPAGMTKRQTQALQKKLRNARKADARAADNAIPRGLSISALKPWVIMRASRAAYYRRDDELRAEIEDHLRHAKRSGDAEAWRRACEIVKSLWSRPDSETETDTATPISKDIGLEKNCLNDDQQQGAAMNSQVKEIKSPKALGRPKGARNVIQNIGFGGRHAHATDLEADLYKLISFRFSSDVIPDTGAGRVFIARVIERLAAQFRLADKLLGFLGAHAPWLDNNQAHAVVYAALWQPVRGDYAEFAESLCVTEAECVGARLRLLRPCTAQHKAISV